MLAFKPELERILREGGWTPERRFCATPWVEQLAREGFVPTPQALAILESFGGLTIVPPSHEFNLFRPAPIVFEPLRAASGEFDRVQEWQRELGVSLFPLGEVFDGAILLISNSGKQFACRDDVLDLLGEDFAAAMSLLVLARSRPAPVNPARFGPSGRSGPKTPKPRC